MTDVTTRYIWEDEPLPPRVASAGYGGNLTTTINGRLIVPGPEGQAEIQRALQYVANAREPRREVVWTLWASFPGRGLSFIAHRDTAAGARALHEELHQQGATIVHVDRDAKRIQSMEEFERYLAEEEVAS